MANSLYPPSSPYYNINTVNGKFLDIMVNRQIPTLASDVYWEITPGYDLRPDMLAFDLYGDSKLWWVFASRNPNRLKDPFFDFVTGTGIYLPTSATLQQTLGL